MKHGGIVEVLVVGAREAGGGGARRFSEVEDDGGEHDGILRRKADVAAEVEGLCETSLGERQRTRALQKARNDGLQAAGFITHNADEAFNEGFERGSELARGHGPVELEAVA